MKKKVFNWRRAGVGWILCLCLACSTLWNCTRDDPGVEEELEWASRSFISDDEIDIEIKGELPPGMGAAFQALENCEVGRRLLREVKNTGIPIEFVILVNEEGNIVGDQELGYKGNGKIGYSLTSLALSFLDELLFHELVHVVHFKDAPVTKSLNNEVEAYLAQYLYAESKRREGEEGGTIDGLVGVYIRTMASYFDWETRGFKFKNDVEREAFDKAYMNAIECLTYEPAYAGYTWSPLKTFGTLFKIFGNE